MKIEGHKILDAWFNGLQARSIIHGLGDSYERWLKVGLHPVSV